MSNRRFEDLTLADDVMFQQVMSDVGLVKIFLETLFERPIARIESHVVQSSKQNQDNRGVRFDVEFHGDGAIYDIEMQQRGGSSVKEIKELLRRTRYYHSMLDSTSLNKGQSYKELPQSYVIFVCTFDPFGEGYAKYTQTPYIDELGAKVDDGSTTIYLNAEYVLGNVSQGILSVLDYLKDPSFALQNGDIYVSMLDKAVQEAREQPEFRRQVMELWEHYEVQRNEGRAEGRAEERDTIVANLMKALKITREQALTLVEGKGLSKGLNSMRLN